MVEFFEPRGDFGGFEAFGEAGERFAEVRVGGFELGKGGGGFGDLEGEGVGGGVAGGGDAGAGGDVGRIGEVDGGAEGDVVAELADVGDVVVFEVVFFVFRGELAGEFFGLGFGGLELGLGV